MIRTEVTIDPKQVARISRMFRDWPGAVPRIFKESINRTAAKAKTNTVRRIVQLTKGLKRKDVNKQVRLYRATLKNWSALIRVKDRGIPISKLGMKAGRAKKTIFEASARQSAWLFYNVFKPKYGAAAVFSRNYRIRRKTHQNITYQVMGQTKQAPPGAFVQTVKNPWAGEGAGAHKGVFVQRAGGGIRELFGPGIGEMLGRQMGEVNKIKAEAGKGLTANVDSRVKRYLKMAKTRRAG